MINVSVLKPKEIQVHDQLITFFTAFDKLSDQSKTNVIMRWSMLHIMNEEETKFFLNWNKRVNTPQT